MSPNETNPPPSGDGIERQLEWAEDSETEAAVLAAAAEVDAGAGGGGAPETFLIVRMGDHVSLLELTDPGEWIIGRSADASVVVASDPQTSRRHARLKLTSRMLTVEDLGSRNGTLVNGQILRERMVRIGTGDIVEVGGCQLVVATRPGRIAAVTSPSGPSSGLVDIVVADPEMARVYASVRKVARMPTTVLLLGETGTGKDVLAQRLIAWSPRADKPFVRVNCAGVPESLLESELFGYERGAFTGADRRKVGYFEAANEGTIFLDEIGELSESAQVKLLNVLENRTITRLGGTEPITIDVRVLCATHRDLQALVTAERFRADLFYRISPFVIRLPPLRSRPAEIELLAGVFARQLAERMGTPPPSMSAEAVAMLMAYPWPGNVRELRNAVEHAYVMAEGGPLRGEHFAPEFRGLRKEAGSTSPPKQIRERLIEVERKTIEEALAAEGGNQTRAAERLGMPRRTLVHKLTRYRRQREGGQSGED